MSTPEPALAPRQEKETAAAPGASRLPFLICELALLAATTYALWWQILAIRRYIGAPFQFDYEEGNILNALARITHGLSPYPDPRQLPSVLNPYGPVAYYLLALPAKLAVTFLYPRLMIVGSVLLICLALSLLLRRQTGSTALALAFAFRYVTLPVVAGWTFLLRVDFLGLALVTVGMCLFCLAPEGKPAGMMFFGLALLVKYSLLAAPAACVLSLLLRRRNRDAASFLVALLVWAGLGLGLAELLTRGAIHAHLFSSHPDPFHWNAYLLRMNRMAAVHLPLVALAAVYLGADFWKRRFSAPALWLLLATGAAVTAGKLGSGWNHFLEWPLALCLCAGLGWHTLTTLRPRRLALVVCGAAFIWVAQFFLMPRPAYDAFTPVEGCAQAYSWVRYSAGPNLLSENVGALVMGGKKVWVSNPFVYNQLVMHRGWSDAELVRMLRERSFDAVLADRDYAAADYFLRAGSERFSPAVLRAIRDNYTVSRRFHCTDANVVYEPASRTSAVGNRPNGPSDHQ